MDDATFTNNCREVLRFEEIFATMLDTKRIRGTVERRPRMLLPEGPSTQAGLHARMAIVIEPATAGEPSLRVGWIDVVARRASLLSHAALGAALHARFATKARVERSSYELFLTSCRRVLVSHGIHVALDGEPPSMPEPTPEPRPRRQHMSLLELSFAAAVGVAACGGTLAVLW